MVGFSLVIFRKGFALLREKTYFCITFFETEKNNHGKLYGKSSGYLSDGASVWHTS